MRGPERCRKGAEKSAQGRHTRRGHQVDFVLEIPIVGFKDKLQTMDLRGDNETHFKLCLNFISPTHLQSAIYQHSTAAMVSFHCSLLCPFLHALHSHRQKYHMADTPTKEKGTKEKRNRWHITSMGCESRHLFVTDSGSRLTLFGGSGS